MEQHVQTAPQKSDAKLKRDIAQGLSSLRSANGWTRADLVELMTGITGSDLAGWETELRIPKGLKLVRVARLLGLNLLSYPTDAVQTLRIQRALRLTKQAPSPVIDIATLIIAKRMQLGLNLREFAAAWGIPITTLQNWERGTMPTGQHAIHVAQRLGLPPTAVGYL